MDPVRSLLNYAECPHDGDWTLRSGLTRLAQPHPVLVGQLLDLSRRLDAPLHHVRRILEANVVVCDRALDPSNLATDPTDPYGDIRTADLARLVDAGCEPEALLAGYCREHELEGEEQRAVPLLAVAVVFERIAAVVAGWALTGPADPPVDDVERHLVGVAAELDRLGVPEESWRPPQGGRNRGV